MQSFQNEGPSITVHLPNVASPEKKPTSVGKGVNITDLRAALHCGGCTHCMAHVALNQLTGPNGERNNFAPGMYCAHTSLDIPVFLSKKTTHAEVELPARIVRIQKRPNTGWSILDELFSYSILTAQVSTEDGTQHICPSGMVKDTIQSIRVSELEPGVPQTF